MKKKFSILLLAVLIVPLVALFGCDEVLSYPIEVYSSSTIYGSVTGSGTYDVGSTVTLTASAKQNSKFVAWIYQNSTQIVNGTTFSISNETNSNGDATKSTLTFVMSDERQGKYTAVFEDSKMVYAKLGSLYLTSDPDSEGTVDDGNATTLATTTLTISQGQTYSNMTTAYESGEYEFKDAIAITPQDITQVLKLSTTEQLVKVNFDSITLRASLNFQTSKDWTQSNGYSHKVNYANGNYKIVFAFTYSNEQMYLVLNYNNLTA